MWSRVTVPQHGPLAWDGDGGLVLPAGEGEGGVFSSREDVWVARTVVAALSCFPVDVDWKEGPC